MVLGAKHLLKEKPDPNLNIGYIKLERVTVVKYLGITIDE